MTELSSLLNFWLLTDFSFEIFGSSSISLSTETSAEFLKEAEDSSSF